MQSECFNNSVTSTAIYIGITRLSYHKQKWNVRLLDCNREVQEPPIMKHEKTRVWLHENNKYFGLRYLFIGNQIEFFILLCPSVINFTERYSVSRAISSRGKDFKWHFWIFTSRIITPRDEHALLFKRFEWNASSNIVVLVEMDSLVLEEIIFHCIAIVNPAENAHFNWNKLEFPPFKNNMSQVWLKLALWFWSSSLEKNMHHHLN